MLLHLNTTQRGRITLSLSCILFFRTTCTTFKNHQGLSNPKFRFVSRPPTEPKAVLNELVFSSVRHCYPDSPEASCFFPSHKPQEHKPEAASFTSMLSTRQLTSLKKGNVSPDPYLTPQCSTKRHVLPHQLGIPSVPSIHNYQGSLFPKEEDRKVPPRHCSSDVLCLLNSFARARGPHHWSTACDRGAPRREWLLFLRSQLLLQGSH